VLPAEVFKKVDNFVLRIGELAKGFMNFIENTLLPFVKEHKESFIAAIKGMGAAILGSALFVALKIAAFLFTALLGPVALVLGIGAAIALAWEKDFLGIRSFLEPIIEGVMEYFGNLFEVAKDAGPFSREMLEAITGPFGQETQDIILKVVDILADFVMKMKDWFEVVIPKAIQFFQDNIEPIKGAVQGVAIFFALWIGIPAIIGLVSGALGILTGILGAIFSPLGLIIAAVALLGAAWKTNFLGIRDIVTAFWENTLKPAFEAIRAWLAEKIPIAMDALKAFWENTLKPVFEAIGGFLGVVIPAAIEFVKNAWENVLLPALQAVWSFISTNIIPILDALVNLWLTILKKEVEILAAFWENVLLPALKKVGSWLTDEVVPAFQMLWTWISEKVGPIFLWLLNTVIGPLIDGLSGVGDAVEGVIGFITGLTEAIGGIEVPKIFQPGSPTLFEMGIRGISEAMKEMNRTVLPEFSTNVRTLGSTAAVGGGGESVDNFNLTVNSNSPVEPVIQDFGVMKAMAKR
jgi:hypothetical protein